jgi:hypothetical protein
MGVEIYMKAGNHWRQLVKVPDIDACAIFKSGSMKTMVKDFAMFMMAHFPWIPTKCPLKPGKFYGNFTVNDFPDPKTAPREEIVKFQQVERPQVVWRLSENFNFDSRISKTPTNVA